MITENSNNKIFDVKSDPIGSGKWLWWFWLFIIDSPKTSITPRQVVIAWTAKNVVCAEPKNNEIFFTSNKEDKNTDGAVVAWYFDGNKMHHNIVMEKCKIEILPEKISSLSKTPTSFYADNSSHKIRIGKDFIFNVKPKSKNTVFTKHYELRKYTKNIGFSEMRDNMMEFSGEIGKESITGTAYFQRVFADAPLVPWSWGIFHFKNGAFLSFLKRHVIKDFGHDISFFDGKKFHNFHDVKIINNGKSLRSFSIKGKNDKEEISFTTVPYASSRWTFKEKIAHILNEKLEYNEYLSTINDLVIVNSDTGKVITSSRDIGRATGNVEYTTGILF